MASNYIEMLKERDKARPLYKKHLTSEFIVPACPACKEIVFSSTHGNFCEWCGQRLDKKNWEL